MLIAYPISMYMLDAELNRKIAKLAPRYTAHNIAPSTYKELTSATQTGLVVWNGASDNTIYGDSSINHAFRAWHDSLHIKLGAGFDASGEHRVAIEQARTIGGDIMGDILMIEVAGQVEYFNKYNEFPKDQVLFTVNYLKGRIERC